MKTFGHADDRDIGIEAVRQQIVERAAESAGKVLSWAERRAGLELATAANPIMAGVTVSDRPLGGVPTDLIEPADVAAGRAILYLHGGGFTTGSPRTHRALAARLACGADARVYAVDYRLAPEHPFPAGLDDVEAAWHALIKSGVAPSQIVVAGDSAGGGLALALGLRLAAKGMAQPAGILALSPWADMLQSATSYQTRASADPILTKPGLDMLSQVYLADADPRHPHASPVYGDFTGVCPILVQVGADEVLLGDALGIAEAAGRAGVAVRLEIWPQMIHVFHAFADRVAQSRQAIRVASDWIDRRLVGEVCF